MGGSLKESMYFNTMVFSITAGVVSLGLLLLLVFGADLVAPYAALIVTLEIGLLAVILLALLRIRRYERKMDRLEENSLNNLVQVRACPDFWTREEVDGDEGSETVCKRAFTVRNPDDGSVTEYKVYQGSSVGGAPDEINLSDYTRRRLVDTCGKLADLQTPWTDLRVTCGTYNVDV